MNDAVNEMKAAEERAKKAQADAQRLSEEVRAEQEHALQSDRERKAMDIQMRVPHLHLPSL